MRLGFCILIMPPLTGLEKFVGSVYYKDVAPMALEFLNDWRPLALFLIPVRDEMFVE